MTLHKFPRTRHIQGSRFQHGDHDLEAVPWEELRGKRLVIEEKCDGSNVGISFDEKGTLLLQSRGHYLRGGPREREFDVLKQWASARQVELFCALGTRYVMYAENMLAKHTVFYDALPHYVMEFDVLDTETGSFLSTPARSQLFSQVPGVVQPVKVLVQGRFERLDELHRLITRSNFITGDVTRRVNLEAAARAAGVDPPAALKHTDMLPEMEGLYLKWEDEGVVRGRYKFVRESFTCSILDQDEHWHDRPIIRNQLVPGAWEAMFT